jgi:folate-binding protein YgfZ
MSYATAEGLILDKLNSFIVADDVELEGQAEGAAGLSLIGDAVSLIENLGFGRAEFGSIIIGEEIVYGFSGHRGAQSSVELISSMRGRDLLLAKLLDMDPDLESLGTSAMELLRILSLCPSIPMDIGPKELPQEGGLESYAVSFTKGCYLGQEVMSRLHSMGQARRSLRLVQSSQPLVYGTDLLSEGKKAGIIKSSVKYGHHYLGLALLSNALADKPVLQVLDGECSVFLVSL